MRVALLVIQHMTMISSCTLAVELLQLLILWPSSTNEIPPNFTQ